MAILSRIKTALKLRRLAKIRKNAIEYMYLLDRQMIKDNVPRAERRRFKKELINCGQHLEGVKLNA